MNEMRRVKIVAGVFEGKSGYFRQFLADENPIAMIEFSDGSVHVVDFCNIRFINTPQLEPDDMVTAVKMIRSACRGKDCYDCPLWNIFHGCTLRDGAPDTWELPEEGE